MTISFLENAPEGPDGYEGSASAPIGESTFELVRRAQTGDRAALDELLVRCLPAIHKWAHRRLPVYARGSLDTDDLVQHAAYQTLRRLHLFRPKHVYSLQAYLKEAVVNRIRDAVRRKMRIGIPEDLPLERPDEQTPSTLEELIRQETVARYQNALMQLKPAERQLVILRIELELPFEEIAARVGKRTDSAARVATSRALDRLAAILREAK